MALISVEAPNGLAKKTFDSKVIFHTLVLIICILVSLSFLFLPLPTFQWFSDYWEHASALRVLAENPHAPTNPHYASYDSDRQFIPLFIALGWLMKITGISVYTALAFAGILTTFLFFSGSALFAKAYFKHFWAPIVTVCVMLFCWGTPWVWTGFYEFRAVFYNNFYPATFVLSLTFFLWALVLRMLEKNSMSFVDLVSLLALSALMFTTHQLGALFAIGGAVLFILYDKRSASKFLQAKIFLIIVSGIGLTWWWPYFNPVELMFSGAGDKENEGVPQFYDLIQVLLLLGPALLGLPILLEMARKRIHLCIIIGFLSLFLVYALGGAAGHPVAHRFLSYSILYLHLAIIWKILSLIPNQQILSLNLLKRSATRTVIVLAAAMLILIQIGFAALDFSRIAYEKISGQSFGSFPNHPVRTELAAVAAVVPDDAIFFATQDPALSITALKGKVIARPRPQLMISDGPTRSKDNSNFFKNDIPDSARWDLIKKYNANYILIRKENISTKTYLDLQRFGTAVPIDGKLTLIKIKP